MKQTVGLGFSQIWKNYCFKTIWWRGIPHSAELSCWDLCRTRRSSSSTPYGKRQKTSHLGSCQMWRKEIYKDAAPSYFEPLRSEFLKIKWKLGKKNRGKIKPSSLPGKLCPSYPAKPEVIGSSHFYAQQDRAKPSSCWTSEIRRVIFLAIST